MIRSRNAAISFFRPGSYSMAVMPAVDPGANSVTMPSETACFAIISLSSGVRSTTSRFPVVDTDR
ncbi:MAG: hypothetical protein A2176_04235 [Spirochaetes bacterium RBG_13_51_14]|nr:MAG: hypothetical protein A2176_04235 [Spirochaetes bacterium RBG_13_51_14]